MFAMAMDGDSESLKQLLAGSSRSVNQQNPDDRTPLFAAATNGHETCVELLLAKDAKVGRVGSCCSSGA